ncbi:MAG: competence protein ComFB [Proteobacteria bacterium]|nr:MAG: competence protein ComFB [Pseudomonadota bacterium]PIE40154.1 MAG: competence protein ComFB [Gammaproteobacteria bacterium]
MSLLDNIRNYYENRVVEELEVQVQEGRFGMDRLTDIVCVALNHLPPRYIRHEVDMAFYLSPVEYDEMKNKVRKAVKEAIAYVEKHEHSRG